MKKKKHSSFNDFAEKINNLTDGIYYIILDVFIIFCFFYFIVDALTAKPNVVLY